MAHHDALTDLPNRIRFLETLEGMLLPTESGAGRVAIFFLDLDGFKDVNDTLGHQVGDELLKNVADRLRGCMEQQGAVARLGGDEFAVVCPMTDEPGRNTDLAGRIVAELSSPYIVEGQEIAIGASVGVVESPRHDPPGPEELMRYADLALYRAKAEGKGRVCFFEPGMDTQLQARKALEADLRNALKRGQLEVHYQPLLIAPTREICGYEALLRWKHPSRGQVPPSEFIPIAEDTGIIGPLGEWVLRQACTEAAGWPSDTTVSVNLSPVQFRSDQVMQTVVGALASSGLAPGRLELEITESVLLDASERTIATLLGLKRLGVRIAMDDFGTGYSSLSNLRSFPFDKIKIDRSFIRDLTIRPEALAVVRLIVGLGESLGMTTTAEGVETEKQYLSLQSVGCTQVQGFLFAHPKPAHELVHCSPSRSGRKSPEDSVIDLCETVDGVRNGRSYPSRAPAIKRISAKGHQA
jgi:diguanylate cyclase (GGDEF)-like protein